MPKFKNFAARKGVQDAARNNQMVKIGRQIMAEVRATGISDPNHNFKLKQLVVKARAINMPVDNIERAIKKGAGDLEGEEYVEIRYEGYGPGGVAVLVHCLTDNRNRSGAEVRATFNKRKGNMGEPNCVAWMFEEKGVLTIDRAETDADEDTVMMTALDAGAEDLIASEDEFEIQTQPSDFEAVKTALEEAGYTISNAEVAMVPKNTVKVTGDDAKNMIKMIETFEDNDDVQHVYTNMEIDEEELAALQG
ncbi:YebC/PmpR family DNA-binding transcriptional regulator [Tumebacillus permanentifrigoris]|uniref:Probable transcriptional regulatory protein C7459_12328 n=1 Tax=Tumebacillus permanentifrigoris TaxID=378543 RepID=A0A316D4W9_9BACL|nr:YebC/PmpR family DNA-binding transcriptional regulator [Tumebacillus permanentifrigoris]PWK05403.1 YebC/PmpR family DNA-binding regulatory protein [Tumebacillus permanentifrigoris]